MVSPIKIVSRVVDQGEQIHNTDTQHSRIMGGGEDSPAQADACNSKAVHTLMRRNRKAAHIYIQCTLADAIVLLVCVLVSSVCVSERALRLTCIPSLA